MRYGYFDDGHYEYVIERPDTRAPGATTPDRHCMG